MVLVNDANKLNFFVGPLGGGLVGTRVGAIFFENRFTRLGTVVDTGVVEEIFGVGLATVVAAVFGWFLRTDASCPENSFSSVLQGKCSISSGAPSPKKLGIDVLLGAAGGLVEASDCFRVSNEFPKRAALGRTASDVFGVPAGLKLKSPSSPSTKPLSIGPGAAGVAVVVMDGGPSFVVVVVGGVTVVEVVGGGFVIVEDVLVERAELVCVDASVVPKSGCDELDVLIIP